MIFTIFKSCPIITTSILEIFTTPKESSYPLAVAISPFPLLPGPGTTYLLPVSIDNNGIMHVCFFVMGFSFGLMCSTLSVLWFLFIAA